MVLSRTCPRSGGHVRGLRRKSSAETTKEVVVVAVPITLGSNIASLKAQRQLGRATDALSSTFERLSPARTVFEGGPGAWEAVLLISYSDFDSASIQGGKFWRITPMVNWYMSKNLRTEFVYGYGVLDRYKMKGSVQIYQVRFQVTLM